MCQVCSVYLEEAHDAIHPHDGDDFEECDEQHGEVGAVMVHDGHYIVPALWGKYNREIDR